MCFSKPKEIQPAPAPPAPEPVPESVAPANTETASTRAQTKIRRKGLSSYRTDLNISGVSGGASSGSGLNVPR